MRILTGDDLEFHSAGGFHMLSISRQIRDIIYAAPTIISTPEFRAIYGFYPYVEDSTIYFIPGEIRFNSAEVSIYDEVSSTNGIHEYAVTTMTYFKGGLLPETSGVIYLDLPVEDVDFPPELEDSLPDYRSVRWPMEFGGNSYGFTFQMELRAVQQLATSFSSGDNSYLKHAAAMPSDLTGHYYHKLATYTVNADGVPSVTPFHIGTIHIPQTTQYKGELFVTGD